MGKRVKGGRRTQMAVCGHTIKKKKTFNNKL